MLTTGDVVLWYDFDDGSGSTITDKSANSINASTIGNPAWSTGSGITNLDSFLDFDGAGDGFNMGDVDAVDGASAFTYACWVNFDDLANKMLWGKDDIGGGVKQGCYIASPDMFFYPSSVNRRAVISMSNFTAATWHHAVFVYDGNGSGNSNRIKVYVDGSAVSVSFVGTIDATSVSNAFSLIWGLRAGTASGGFNYNGGVAQFQVFNKALDASEVGELYNSGNGTTYAQLFSASTYRFVPQLRPFAGL